LYQVITPPKHNYRILSKGNRTSWTLPQR